MNQRGRLAKAGFASALTLGLFVSFQQARSEMHLRNLVAASERSEALPRFKSHEEMLRWRRDFRERNQRFARLWLSRQQRDVSKDFLPFLKDSSIALRMRAIRALGRLENPQAEYGLRSLLKQKGQLDRDQSTLIKFALGRIRSRKLKGQAKLNVVLDTTGLSFGQVARLSQLVNTNSRAQDSVGEAVVNEVVAMLYSMGKDGQNIRPLSVKLTLNPAQRMLIRCATLPVDREIQVILERLSNPKGTRGSAYALAEHLVALGPRANNAALEHLRKMLRQPQKYPQQLGYKMAFRPLVLSADKRALPLLEQFKKSSNPYIREQATRAQAYIKGREIVPNFPA